MALFELVSSTGANHAILDGMVEPGGEPIIRVYAEDVGNAANGISDVGVFDGKILVGHPTKSVLTMMLNQFGYECVFFDWEALLRSRDVKADRAQPHGHDNPVGDYARGARATALATRRPIIRS